MYYRDEESNKDRKSQHDLNEKKRAAERLKEQATRRKARKG